MEQRGQFTFYESVRSALRCIKSKAARADAYDAICDYALYGVEPELDRLPELARLVFISAKPNLEAGRKKALSGKRGGEGKQTASKPEANSKQIPSKTENKKENKIEIKTETENKGNAPEEVQRMYHRHCKMLPACTVLSQARRKDILDRLSGAYTLKDFDTLFQKAAASSFLSGKNPRGWVADFDWLIRDNNMAKVLSGNYDDRKEPVPNGGGPMGEAELAAIRRLLEEDG